MEDWVIASFTLQDAAGWYDDTDEDDTPLEGARSPLSPARTDTTQRRKKPNITIQCFSHFPVVGHPWTSSSRPTKASMVTVTSQTSSSAEAMKLGRVFLPCTDIRYVLGLGLEHFIWFW